MATNGYILRSTLNENRISPDKFAEIIGTDRRHVYALLNDNAYMTPEKLNDYIRQIDEYVFFRSEESRQRNFY